MTIVEGVGWVLLHFVWEGTVIALALAALLALTRDGQARLRYALSCGALTLMLVAALATAGAVMAGRAGCHRPEAALGATPLRPACRGRKRRPPCRRPATARRAARRPTAPDERRRR